MAKRLNQVKWESLCDRCGLCCEIKGQDGKGTGIACPMYDTVNRRCSDYENRRERFPPCIKLTQNNINTPFVRSALPPSCGYVRFADGVKPARLDNPPRKNLIPWRIAHPDFMKRMLEAWKQFGELKL